MKKKTFFFFLVLVFWYGPLTWAKVVVEGSSSLASYTERRGPWSFLVGTGNLQNKLGIWENNINLDMTVRRCLARSMFDVGTMYQYQAFPNDYRQNALGLGMWASRIWSEPYAVPFLAVIQNFPTKDVPSFLNYQVGALIGLSWLEPDSYFRLREELSVEHVYFDVSYFNSLDHHVEYSGYLLGIKVEW